MQLGGVDDVVGDRHRLLRVVLERPAEAEQELATQIAIQLSMIVVITSCAPTVALSSPAMPAQAAPARDRDDDGEDDVQERVHPRERRADPDGEDRADEILALASDVEHAAAEGECDRDAGEDQRRRDQQRLLQVQLGENRASPWTQGNR